MQPRGTKRSNSALHLPNQNCVPFILPQLAFYCLSATARQNRIQMGTIHIEPEMNFVNFKYCLATIGPLLKYNLISTINTSYTQYIFLNTHTVYLM